MEFRFEKWWANSGKENLHIRQDRHFFSQCIVLLIQSYHNTIYKQWTFTWRHSLLCWWNGEWKKVFSKRTANIWYNLGNGLMNKKTMLDLKKYVLRKHKTRSGRWKSFYLDTFLWCHLSFVNCISFILIAMYLLISSYALLLFCLIF